MLRRNENGSGSFTMKLQVGAIAELLPASGANEKVNHNLSAECRWLQTGTCGLESASVPQMPKPIRPALLSLEKLNSLESVPYVPSLALAKL